MRANAASGNVLTLGPAATSCSRAPLLGFRYLQPPFTIARQRADDEQARNDDEYLPSASTCFNVLRLGTYSSKAALRDKLLQAVESGAGFEFS